MEKKGWLTKDEFLDLCMALLCAGAIWYLAHTDEGGPKRKMLFWIMKAIASNPISYWIANGVLGYFALRNLSKFARSVWKRKTEKE